MASHRVRGDKIRKTVILDSSAVLMFFEFSVDWEQELARLLDSYRIIVPTAVIRELEILANQTSNPKHRKASAALKLIQRYDTINTEAMTGDDAVLEAAKTTQGVILTNDTELRIRAKKDSIPVVFLRGKKKLALEE
jgi:rRNA-processing protein FCF1